MRSRHRTRSFAVLWAPILAVLGCAFALGASVRSSIASDLLDQLSSNARRTPPLLGVSPETMPLNRYLSAPWGYHIAKKRIRAEVETATDVSSKAKIGQIWAIQPGTLLKVERASADKIYFRVDTADSSFRSQIGARTVFSLPRKDFEKLARREFDPTAIQKAMSVTYDSCCSLAPAVEPEPRKIPQPAKLWFSFSGSSGSRRGEPQVTWDECKGSVQGRYSEASGCNSSQKISKIFSQFLNNRFGGCVNEGLMELGYVSTGTARIIHDGITGDSEHQARVSQHNLNRAIDIDSLEIHSAVPVWRDAAPKRLKLKASKDAPAEHQKFWVKFTQCWRKAVIDHYTQVAGAEGARRCLGQGRTDGVIWWKDPVYARHDHSHHLHLSLPPCPSGGSSE